jgi:hypothetical protein
MLECSKVKTLVSIQTKSLLEHGGELDSDSKSLSPESRSSTEPIAVERESMKQRFTLVIKYAEQSRIQV